MTFSGLLTIVSALFFGFSICACVSLEGDTIIEKICDGIVRKTRRKNIIVDASFLYHYIHPNEVQKFCTTLELYCQKYDKNVMLIFDFINLNKSQSKKKKSTCMRIYRIMSDILSYDGNSLLITTKYINQLNSLLFNVLTSINSTHISHNLCVGTNNEIATTSECEGDSEVFRMSDKIGVNNCEIVSVDNDVIMIGILKHAQNNEYTPYISIIRFNDFTVHNIIVDKFINTTPIGVSMALIGTSTDAGFGTKFDSTKISSNITNSQELVTVPQPTLQTKNVIKKIIATYSVMINGWELDHIQSIKYLLPAFDGNEKYEQYTDLLKSIEGNILHSTNAFESADVMCTLCIWLHDKKLFDQLICECLQELLQYEKLTREMSKLSKAHGLYPSIFPIMGMVNREDYIPFLLKALYGDTSIPIIPRMSELYKTIYQNEHNNFCKTHISNYHTIRTDIKTYQLSVESLLFLIKSLQVLNENVIKCDFIDLSFVEKIGIFQSEYPLTHVFTCVNQKCTNVEESHKKIMHICIYGSMCINQEMIHQHMFHNKPFDQSYVIPKQICKFNGRCNKMSDSQHILLFDHPVCQQPVCRYGSNCTKMSDPTHTQIFIHK